MEERKTVVDYLAQAFCSFGISVTILCVLCMLFGEDAKEISTMFRLGEEGLSVPTLLQFLLVSLLIGAIRTLFFTDLVIKNLPLWLRTVGMMAAILALTAVFVFIYGWFPVDMWQPWILFFICFAVCAAAGTLMVGWKEKQENRRMEEALEKLKKEEEA